MTKKIYLVPLKSVLSRSILHYSNSGYLLWFWLWLWLWLHISYGSLNQLCIFVQNYQILTILKKIIVSKSSKLP